MYTRTANHLTHLRGSTSKGGDFVDINSLTNAISLVGFPVIMCGALFWYIYTSQAKTQEILMELTQVISELKVVIQNDEK